MPTEDARTEEPADAIPDEITAWNARCPNCEEIHLTMLTRKRGTGGPWTEIVGGATEVAEKDYYCTDCRSFVNLKEAEVWERAQA